MDLTKLKEAYPKFLLLLKDRGYKATTIEKYQWVINRLLSEAQVSDIRSFEDYFVLLKGRLSAKSLPEVKTYLGALKRYVESGVFHRDHSCRSGFMEKSSYTQLNEYYRVLVDNCLLTCEKRKRHACSTVRSIKSAGSVFCLYFQQHGCKSFGYVKSAICRFMNASAWVDWAYKMLQVYEGLSDELKEAYAFLTDYRKLIEELHASVGAIRYIEGVCKNEGFCLRNYSICRDYIIKNVIGDANNRRAMLGIQMLKYLDKQKAVLPDCTRNENISSDIIESDFGIFKTKKSPNKLFGITPFVLFLPLYSKIINENAADTFNFKECLVNVKLKDINAYAIKHMSKNWVTERTKTLANVR